MAFMEWKQHPVYTQYEVSDSGEVRHYVTKRSRKFRFDHNGYHRFNIKHADKIITLLVHKVVAECFVGEWRGQTINHIDGDKLNNAASNLEIISAEDNLRHAFRAGLMTFSKPIVINGVHYYSKREAERKTGIDRHKIHGYADLGNS